MALQPSSHSGADSQVYAAMGGTLRCDQGNQWPSLPNNCPGGVDKKLSIEIDYGYMQVQTLPSGTTAQFTQIEPQKFLRPLTDLQTTLRLLLEDKKDTKRRAV